MLGTIIEEVLKEVRQEELQKQASKAAMPAPASEAPSEEIEKLAEIKTEIAQKLERLGLGKYAAYVEEMKDPVAAQFAVLLLDEMEKVVAQRMRETGINPFKVSDRPDKNAVDPITAFALGLS